MVRILKDGSYNNFHYKKGEIYKIKNMTERFVFLDIDKDITVIVSYTKSGSYDKEAEIIEIKNTIELWD